MATTRTLYRSETGTPAAIGDELCLSDFRKWTVIEILEIRQNGDQLLRLELPDEDLSSCNRA
jgi:hypothetical protein